MRGRSFYEHLAGEDGPSSLLAQSLPPEGGADDYDMLATLPNQEGVVMSGAEDSGRNPDVRVDDPMDRRVPVAAEGPEVFGPSVPAAAEGPEVFGTVYRVGPRTCHLTDGDTRMTCKKCGRYVTSYKGTWRNLGTIAKQPCKPKARGKLKGREGKAPCKQSGGALPALPPGSRPRGRAPGPHKKLKSHDSRTPVAPSTTAALNPEVQRVSEQHATAFSQSPAEELGGSSGDQGLRQCALCRGTFPVARLQDRAIRDQTMRVCSECLTSHPKTLPKKREAQPDRDGVKRRLARDPGARRLPWEAPQAFLREAPANAVGAKNFPNQFPQNLQYQEIEVAMRFGNEQCRLLPG
eukprot:2739236-Amphidinium_carterae.1